MRVNATAAGKLNLLFRVGQLRPDGYHEVVSIYQSVNIRESVGVERASNLQLSVSGSIIRDQLAAVPVDASNLVVKAAQELALAFPAADRDAMQLDFEILKQIPLLGGMAGGSADAAAALVAVAKLWQIDLTATQLFELGARLGSDVPFSLMGGTALGKGRGELLTPLDSKPFNWVLVFSRQGLSTPEVFRALDARRKGWSASALAERASFSEEELVSIRNTLSVGDARGLAEMLENDLEAAACDLLPELIETMDLARNIGALHAQVSGSGPTVFLLAESEAHAGQLCGELQERGFRAVSAVGPAPGAALG